MRCSNDVTTVYQRSSAAVKQDAGTGARTGTCHKQDTRKSDRMRGDAIMQAHPWLIVISGSCTYRHVHTVTSFWQGSRSCVILYCNCVCWLNLHDLSKLRCRPNCAPCHDSHAEQYLSKIMCEFYGRAQENPVVQYLVAEQFENKASSVLTTLALISSLNKIHQLHGATYRNNVILIPLWEPRISCNLLFILFSHPLLSLPRRYSTTSFPH